MCAVVFARPKNGRDFAGMRVFGWVIASSTDNLKACLNWKTIEFANKLAPRSSALQSQAPVRPEQHHEWHGRNDGRIRKSQGWKSPSSVLQEPRIEPHVPKLAFGCGLVIVRTEQEYCTGAGGYRGTILFVILESTCSGRQAAFAIVC